MWRVFVYLAVAFTASIAYPLEEDWRVQRFNERYDDFFAHLRAEEQYAERRQAAAAEVEKEHQQWDKKMDAARLNYIKEKTSPPDRSADYQAWETGENKWRDDHERARREYVNIENRIEVLERSAKRIPENVEYDLEP